MPCRMLRSNLALIPHGLLHLPHLRQRVVDFAVVGAVGERRLDAPDGRDVPYRDQVALEVAVRYPLLTRQRHGPPQLGVFQSGVFQSGPDEVHVTVVGVVVAQVEVGLVSFEASRAVFLQLRVLLWRDLQRAGVVGILIGFELASMDLSRAVHRRRFRCKAVALCFMTVADAVVQMPGYGRLASPYQGAWSGGIDGQGVAAATSIVHQ